MKKKLTLIAGILFGMSVLAIANSKTNVAILKKSKDVKNNANGIYQAVEC